VWRSLLERRSSAPEIELATTPAHTPDTDEVLEPAWDPYSQIPGLDDLSGLLPSRNSTTPASGKTEVDPRTPQLTTITDPDGWFLMSRAIWAKLGARKIWVSFSIGFDGGRHFRRRASTQEPFRPCLQNDDKLNLQWTDCRGKIKRDLVEIQYLNPSPPTARRRQGIVLSGDHQGELIVVERYERVKKRLVVALLGESYQNLWEELENNVCWVEPFA
jgi:hypothetical protein